MNLNPITLTLPFKVIVTATMFRELMYSVCKPRPGFHIHITFSAAV